MMTFALWGWNWSVKGLEPNPGKYNNRAATPRHDGRSQEPPEEEEQFRHNPRQQT